MAVHDTIILEEPFDKRFDPMLDGKVSIDAYLEDQELEYPEFSRRMARVLRERRQAGTRLVQVEPFIELLLSIHDHYWFHPRGRFQAEDLLAARALIYNKLILKEEIADDAHIYPHTRDELEIGSVTDRLSLDDCRLLYPSVRRASTTDSRKIVKHHLGERWPVGRPT